MRDQRLAARQIRLGVGRLGTGIARARLAPRCAPRARRGSSHGRRRDRREAIQRRGHRARGITSDRRLQAGIVIRPRSDARLPGDDASRCPTEGSRAAPARSSPRRRPALGHRKRPRSSLFVNRHAPWPSCQITFNRSPRRPRKQNRWPPKRIAPKHLLHLQRQARQSPCAYPCARSPATPARPSGSGSSPLQDIEDPGQGSGVDASTDDYAPPAAQHDLHPIIPRLGAAQPRVRRHRGGRLGHDHSRNEARHWCRLGSLSAQCAMPSQKLRAGDPVSPRRREIRGVGRPGSPTRSWPSRPQTSDGAGPSRRPQAARRHCAYDRPYALFSARRTPRRKAALTESSPRF